MAGLNPNPMPFEIWKTRLDHKMISFLQTKSLKLLFNVFGFELT